MTGFWAVVGWAAIVGWAVVAVGFVVAVLVGRMASLGERRDRERRQG